MICLEIGSPSRALLGLRQPGLESFDDEDEAIAASSAGAVALPAMAFSMATIVQANWSPGRLNQSVLQIR